MESLLEGLAEAASEFKIYRESCHGSYESSNHLATVGDPLRALGGTADLPSSAISFPKNF